MRQSALLWAAAEEIEAVAAMLDHAVPHHWTGRAAAGFARSATNLATGVAATAENAREAARLARQHELESAAMQAALANGAAVAV